MRNAPEKALGDITLSVGGIVKRWTKISSTSNRHPKELINIETAQNTVYVQLLSQHDSQQYSSIKTNVSNFKINHVGMDVPYARTWARVQGVGAWLTMNLPFAIAFC